MLDGLSRIYVNRGRRYYGPVGRCSRRLVVNNVGLVDARDGVPVSTFKSNQRLLIGAQLPVGDMVLVVPLPADTGTFPAQTQADYRQAYYDLADEFDIGLIDLSVRFGPWANKLSGVHGRSGTCNCVRNTPMLAGSLSGLCSRQFVLPSVNVF